MNIDPIYLNSPLIQNSLNSDFFKNMTLQEFQESESFQHIVKIKTPKYFEELAQILESLQYFLIEDIPEIVLDYFLGITDIKPILMLIEEHFPNFFNQIVEFLKSNIFRLQDYRFKFEFFGDKRRIACGSLHSVGIREDGSLVTWGINKRKQQDNCPKHL